MTQERDPPPSGRPGDPLGRPPIPDPIRPAAAQGTATPAARPSQPPTASGTVPAAPPAPPVTPVTPDNKALVEALATATRETQAARADLARSQTQVTQLLEENKRLAERPATTDAEIEALKKATEEARAAQKQADDRAAKLASDMAALQTQMNDVQRVRQRLETDLATAQAQIAARNVPQLLNSQQVAGLIDDFVSSMGSSFEGLQATDGEVRLKVGFSAAGDTKGFVVPTIENAERLGAGLSEMSFRFRVKPANP